LNEQVFDVGVIGGGPGGYVAALRAADLGASVGLAEMDMIGGTCLNRGCIPAKALLESVRLMRAVRRAADFGLRVDGVTADVEKVAARAQSIVEQMRKGVEDFLAKKKVTVLRGKARLASKETLEIAAESGNRRIRAGKVIIATGSRWISLPGVDPDGDKIMTSDHALDLKHVGGAMTVVGGGAVGCEVAEIYSAFGTKITIVEMMDHLLPQEDAEIARRLEVVLKRKGIEVITGARVARVHRGDRLDISLEDGRTLQSDRLLIGIGRRPNTEGLGLEEVGVAVGKKGISTDSRLRTNVEGIFAVGDVTGEFLLAHTAMMQGVVAAENACGVDAEMNYAATPRSVYTDPEFAAVGITEAQAAEQGTKPQVYRVRLGRIGRAITLGETFGLAKLVCEGPQGKILGFHVLAPHASELVSEMTLAITRGLTPQNLAETIHPHPTLSEILWEVTSDAAGKNIHGE
jgi:dihydrolipoamide dehydrogenase